MDVKLSGKNQNFQDDDEMSDSILIKSMSTTFKSLFFVNIVEDSNFTPRPYLTASFFG